MDKNKLLEEIKDNTLDELEFIYDSQKDLYSEEEMAIIKEKIEQYKKEERAKIEKMLPKEIECPKCGGPNPFKNDTCSFCGYKLNKQKYYNIDYYNNVDSLEEDSSTEKSYTFQYIISFLIPLIGFILGAILLSKDNEDEVSIGKQCIILGIVSIIAYVVLILII